MTDRVFSPSRRALLAGLGGAALASGLRLPAVAQTGTSLALRARPGTLAPGTGGTGPAVWALEGGNAGPLRFARGDLAVTLSNELPAPIVLNWLGIDGAAPAEPLTGQAPVPPGGRAAFALPLRQPGTYLLSGNLLGDATALPIASRALIVDDTPPPIADRDEVLLIEEWRGKPGSGQIAPGTSPDGTTSFFGVNGQSSIFNLAMKTNERVRLRLINGSARSPFGLRIENYEVRVIAIDGAPAEPFVARGGQLVLAPGSRIDALIDGTLQPFTISHFVLHAVTGPQTLGSIRMLNAGSVRDAPLPPPAELPAVNLPARLNLQGALRADLSLDPSAQWIAPTAFSASTAPAWRAKRGRTVVVALTNPTTAPMTFRLHGHHFRLLDRLDDGWKPFWLDTLIVDKGQTQRIAFAADHAGRWLMEATATNWAAPKLVRTYAVD